MKGKDFFKDRFRLVNTLIRTYFKFFIRAKEEWFTARENENSTETLKQKLALINEYFQELEKNFDQPSNLSRDKLERIANLIIEEKVRSYHIDH